MVGEKEEVIAATVIVEKVGLAVAGDRLERSLNTSRSFKAI